MITTVTALANSLQAIRLGCEDHAGDDFEVALETHFEQASELLAELESLGYRLVCTADVEEWVREAVDAALHELFTSSPILK